ncbi:MAG: hypothetical protein FWG94_07960, partial [Oscillospiraceae bacterium]|nr:hypothetical protein [Oscillospiraceae bacterium]
MFDDKYYSFLEDKNKQIIETTMKHNSSIMPNKDTMPTVAIGGKQFYTGSFSPNDNGEVVGTVMRYNEYLKSLGALVIYFS